MVDKILVQGNEAVGWGALSGGCDGFFGYPITPQNEVPEWFAREFPERGKVFVQSQSETGSINMLLGGAAAGFRVMTSTSSPGWGLELKVIIQCYNPLCIAVFFPTERGKVLDTLIIFYDNDHDNEGKETIN